jgi:hypothetical protein
VSLSAGVALLFLLAQAQPPGLVPTIEVRPSSSNVSVGERFQVGVELRGLSGITYDFPNEISDGSLDLIQSRAAGTATQAVYDAQVFAMGAAAKIPEIVIQYKTADGATGSVKSEPIALNVVSTLDPAEQNPLPADFAPPMAVKASRAFWIANALLAVLLIAAFIFAIRRLRFPRKPADPHATPAITPEEEALKSLDALAANRTTDPKAFYIQLVQVLKTYLERRLEAPILEMTSTETLGFVKAHAWTGPHATALRDLITAADLAKFGGSSDATNAERHVQLVRDIVGRIDRLRRTELEMARAAESRKTA